MLKVDAGVGIGTRWLMWAAVRLFASKIVGVPAAMLTVSLTAALTARLGYLPQSPLHAWAAAVSAAALVGAAISASFEDRGSAPRRWADWSARRSSPWSRSRRSRRRSP